MAGTRGKIDIRPGTLADADVLARIGGESFRDAYGPHSDAVDVDAHIQEVFTSKAVRADMQQHDCHYLLATVDASPGGMAKYLNAACPTPGGAGSALELKQLYVLTDMQGLGLGRKLVQRLADIGREGKVAGIWLSAWKEADWALNFYRSMDFSVVGEAMFAVGATEYEDFLMWKSLE